MSDLGTERSPVCQPGRLSQMSSSSGRTSRALMSERVSKRFPDCVAHRVMDGAFGSPGFLQNKKRRVSHGHVAQCEGLRTPAHHRCVWVHGGRRRQASKEGTRGPGWARWCRALRLWGLEVWAGCVVYRQGRRHGAECGGRWGFPAGGGGFAGRWRRGVATMTAGGAASEPRPAERRRGRADAGAADAAGKGVGNGRRS